MNSWRTHRVRWLSIGAVIALLAAGFVAASVIRDSRISEGHTAWSIANGQFIERAQGAASAIATATGVIDAATTTLDDSALKVLDEAPRVALSSALDSAESRIVLARQQLAESADLSGPEPDDSFFAPGSGLRSNATVLSRTRFSAADDLAAIRDELAAPTRAVLDAVAVWQAEQDRILSERYHNNVHAVGWIPELDECKGSVDLTAHYGTPAIAEHWSCGGKNFPDDPGTIVVLTGVREGIYRVEGIVKMLNQHHATTADIPHGYDLLYQTCQNGQPVSMSLTALTRIG